MIVTAGSAVGSVHGVVVASGSRQIVQMGGGESAGVVGRMEVSRVRLGLVDVVIVMVRVGREAVVCDSWADRMLVFIHVSWWSNVVTSGCDFTNEDTANGTRCEV